MAYVEVDYFQLFKDQQRVGGDAFLSRKVRDENRVISVLSDGLGSGVKANVLSTLTATMALNYVTNHMDIEKAARVIMKTLPVCKTRKISYSTFSIVDVEKDNRVRIVEYDNPPFLLVRNGKVIDTAKQSIKLDNNTHTKEDVLKCVEFKARLGDRIILFSDGVSQSGMGTPEFPLGWRESSIRQFVCGILEREPELSARDLSRRIVQKAYTHNYNAAWDDITCGVINVRQPRELLIMTGPPIHKERDQEMAEIFELFTGEKILCGGTTANIISRELGRPIDVDLSHIHLDVPPTSNMQGASLVTEGTITLGKVVEILESGLNPDSMKPNGAVLLVQHLLNHDKIHFCVGTKINDAHQDPHVPVELEIRRNIIKRIQQALEDKHLKETTLQFI
ncbi:MAG: SpoIIE family protein phosphatase [candidate division KSB1 bacterium]|nr:SpoIIE family protein phosphatase [candidate division KSB1 bacterium]